MGSPRIAFLLATLAAAAYVPFLSFPFIANSFIEIPVCRILGSFPGLMPLVANANWHFRITYVLANSWLEQMFGFAPKPFYVASLLFHACSVLLVYGLGRWRAVQQPAALWSAGFFAVYQAHHGAVVSLASWPDLLTTLFACASFYCWIRWFQGNLKVSYALALVWYLGALISSESAFIVVLLLALPLFTVQPFNRAKALSLIPFGVLALATIAIQLSLRPKPVAWSDSLPSLDPWWVTLAWACAACGIMLFARERDSWKLMSACAAWVLAVFLVGLYASHILGVSLSTNYLASIGLALMVGTGFSRLQRRLPMSAAAAIAIAVVVINVGLLWTRSRRQMLDFAAPTQALIAAAAFARGPVELSCFPYSFEVAQAAAGSIGEQVSVEKPGSNIKQPHCVSFRYRDSVGSVRQVFLHSAI
jgi:hypothetical protein